MTTESNSLQDSLEVRELLAALPEEINEEKVQNDLPADLISHISTKKVPVGSLVRMWTLGSMQAKIATGYLAYAVRSNFLNKTEKQKLLNETNLTAALKLFGTMGYLRGAIMKVGQMLGNLPTVLPQEFADVLGSLHFEAPPMHYSMIREVFLNELGKEPEEIFVSFERKAFAAASLGQVHRARLKTGEEVAVKIQYPSMDSTINADMQNLRLLLMPMCLTSEWDYIKDHLQDIEEMLKLEADYEKEALFLQKAYELFKQHDQITVPRYYPQYSSSKVLTMDYLDGNPLTVFLKENPSSTARNHFGELISVALMRLSYYSRTYYTDPHPGNFLMLDNGSLGFIDFGCYRKLTDKEWEVSNDGEKALMFSHDEELLNKVIAQGCLHADVKEMDQSRVDLIRKSIQWQAEPAQENAPFDFSNDDWFQRGVDINMEIIKQHQSRYTPAWNWTTRTLIGHRTLMYRLKCKFNFRKLYIENNPFISSDWAKLEDKLP
ncbi:MAG: AarF/ABC1/UbiB kinase family protein [Thermodesulfobacteriota bacterium]